MEFKEWKGTGSLRAVFTDSHGNLMVVSRDRLEAEYRHHHCGEDIIVNGRKSREPILGQAETTLAYTMLEP